MHYKLNVDYPDQFDACHPYAIDIGSRRYQNVLVPAPDLPEALYRVIGKRISQLRGQLGVTQDVLGMFSGLTRASVANIEKGRQRISIHQLYQFADCLGVHPKDLLPDPAEVRQLRIVPEAEAAYLRKIKNYTPGSERSPSKEGHRRK